jgi:O-antigen ligase
MSARIASKNLEKQTANGWIVLLTVILVLRIGSYLMLSEQVAVVQLTKAGLRIGLTLLVAFLVSHELLQRRNAPTFLLHASPLSLYITYLLLGLASFIWTSNLQVSTEQWLMDVEGLVFAGLFIFLLHLLKSRFQRTETMLPIVLKYSILLVGVYFFLGMHLDPDRFYRLTHGGSVSRLGGFIINPNELGMLLVIGTAFYLSGIVKQGKVRISGLLAIVFLVHLLLLTGSRSSLVSLVLVLLVHGVIQGNGKLRFLFLLTPLAVIPIAGWSFFVKQGQLEELFTFTGRLPFWSDLLTYNFPKAPWLGFGYMRIDIADKFDSLHAYSGAMTHNTFLQVLLGLGFVGLMVVLLQLSSTLYTLYHMSDRQLRRQLLLLLIPLLVNSCTEFGIFGETNYGILFYLFLVFSVVSEPGAAWQRISTTPRHEKPKHFPYRPAPAA